ncbi:hypothetical protein D3C72_585240 [compost metagenome]
MNRLSLQGWSVSNIRLLPRILRTNGLIFEWAPSREEGEPISPRLLGSVHHPFRPVDLVQPMLLTLIPLLDKIWVHIKSSFS